MVNEYHIRGYENFIKLMETLKNHKNIVIFYSGSKLPNGQSWCSDCVKADPFMQQTYRYAPSGSHFVHVEVGDRAFWKDRKCPFRTDPKTKLNVLPTWSLWGTQKRLEGDQCMDLDLFEMMFNDD